MGAKSPQRGPRIRQLSGLSVSAMAILVLGTLGTMSWASFHQGHAAQTAVLAAHSLELAGELELALLTYQRISNLSYFRDRADEQIRDGLEARIWRLVERSSGYAGDEEEVALVEQVAGRLRAYFARRRQAEHEAQDLREVISGSVGALNDAITVIEALRQMNEDELDQAFAESARARRISNLTGIVAGSLVLLVLLAVVVGVERWILRPILDLHGAVRRFRSGALETRASPGGCQETTELGRDLNDMFDSLMQQRQNMLAFLAGVAHDLRNPLTGLRLGIQRLQRSGNGVPLASLEMLHRQTDRINRMIDDLQEAARIEAGYLELKPASTDLRELVHRMVEIFRETSPAHRILVRVPAQPLWAVVDPVRLEQVLANLLSNAIKFSDPGSEVTVRLALEEGGPVLAVSDEGVGIDEADIPGLFAPFRRRRPDLAPGAGLGLSVVDRIVRAHGGRIEVDSTPGQGSTFRVRLPGESLVDGRPSASP